MADVLIAYGSSTNTYGWILRATDGKVWDVANNTWATFTDANIGNYAITCTQLGTSSKHWTLAIPTHANFSVGRFTAIYFSRTGGSPSLSDFPLGTSAPTSFQTFTFDGSHITDEIVYHAKVDLNIDAGNSKDEWTVVWYRNGVAVTPTTPQIQLLKRSDGSDLLATTSMSQVGSTLAWKYDATSTNRTTAGEATTAVLTATIDGAVRTWYEHRSRDA